MISQKSVQDILNRAQIDEVVEEFVNLKRRGANMIGLCPFHAEKTPSFTVSPSKNIYKCFGCGKGGNPVQFVMEHESMTFPEALRFLAKRYQIEIEEDQHDDNYEEEKKLIDSLYLVNQFAKEFYQNNLFNTDEGRSIGLSYFKERGFREEIIKSFDLGYASSKYDDFTKAAIDKQYNIEHLRTLRLTTEKDIDFFRSRVLFAIHNLSGKVIGFGGRILSNNKNAPKYLNSSESEIYNKRKVLYGIYQAKKAIRKEDNCFIVEGYTDVLSLHQNGIENVVASSGTALTEDQVRLIKRYTENITLLYDGDAAGIKAASRGLDLVLEQEMNVNIVLLPDGNDPDSFIKSEGSTAFGNFIAENAKDFILFKLGLINSEIEKDPIRKTALIKDIVQTLARIPDAIKRSVYIQQSSKLLDIREDILVAETNKSIAGLIKQKRLEKDRESYRERLDELKDEPSTKGPKQFKHDQQAVDHFDDSIQERNIIRLIVNYGDKWFDEEKQLKVLPYVLDSISELCESLTNPLYDKIYQAAIQEFKNSQSIPESFFINHPDEEIRALSIDLVTSPYTFAKWEERQMGLQTSKPPEENQKKDALRSLLRFLDKKMSLKIKEQENYIAKLSKSEELDEDSFNLELQVLNVLYKQRNELADRFGTTVYRI